MKAGKPLQGIVQQAPGSVALIKAKSRQLLVGNMDSSSNRNIPPCTWGSSKTVLECWKIFQAGVGREGERSPFVLPAQYWI